MVWQLVQNASPEVCSIMVCVTAHEAATTAGMTMPKIRTMSRNVRISEQLVDLCRAPCDLRIARLRRFELT